MTGSELAIIIATKGRPGILEETLKSLEQQTLPAGHIFVSVSSLDDAPRGESAQGVTVLIGSPGGSTQRNTAIRQVPSEVKYIAFFDDDVEIHPSYLEKTVSFLEENPSVVAVSGIMLADGDISRQEAREVLEEDRTWRNKPSLQDSGPHHVLYACNAV